MPFWQAAVAPGSAGAVGTRPSQAGVLTFPSEVPGAPHRGVGGDRIVAVPGTVGTEAPCPGPGAPHRGVGGDRIVAVPGTVGTGQGGSGGVGAVFWLLAMGSSRARVRGCCYLLLSGIRIAPARARDYKTRVRCRKSYPQVDVDNFAGCSGRQIGYKWPANTVQRQDNGGTTPISSYQQVINTFTGTRLLTSYRILLGTVFADWKSGSLAAKMARTIDFRVLRFCTFGNRQEGL
jgi:hypothetical protein